MPAARTTAKKTTTARDLTGEIAFLTRALKAPTLRESVDRLAERARAESWTHKESTWAFTGVLVRGAFLVGQLTVLHHASDHDLPRSQHTRKRGLKLDTDVKKPATKDR